MTITGKYFGDTKGRGTVIFKNANEGNLYPILPIGNPTKIGEGIENYDVVTWSDNEIVLILPSIIDSITTDPNNIHYQSIPGSGRFMVKNKSDTYKESTGIVTIPFAVHQQLGVFSNEKLNARLSGQNQYQGYTIDINQNFLSTFPDARPVIAKAMRDWSCVSGVNWKLGVTTNNDVSQDNQCVITLNPFANPPIGGTVRNIQSCPAGNIDSLYQLSFDILVDSAVNWHFDTLGAKPSNLLDFYTMISHELGHAHLLSHANDEFFGIMHFGQDIAYQSQSVRKRVWTDPVVIVGADYIASNLIGTIDGCTVDNQHELIFPDNCEGLSISENIQDEILISVFPNPINEGNLKITLNLEEPRENYFLLYNSMGMLVKSTEPETEKSIEYTLSVENLSSGIYFIQVFVGNQKQTVKFVKK